MVSFYSKNSELSIRDELVATFEGSGIETSKQVTGILRRMRRTNNVPILCSCIDPVTKEQTKDFWCGYCWGDRYYWDESFIKFYKKDITLDSVSALALKSQGAGLKNIGLAVFYFRWNEKLTTEDKILEINLDIEGNVPSSISRTRKWRISDITEFRLDNARVEYYKVFCSEEDTRYLNSPNG